MYNTFNSDISWIKKTIQDFKQNREDFNSCKLPEDTWLLGNRYILTIPGKAEIRYPMGVNGYNFWSYSNGRMHSNYGLFSPFLKSTEGMEEKLAFFFGIKEKEGKYNYYSLLPNMDDYDDTIERYTIFSPHQVYYITVHSDFYGFLRVFTNSTRETYFSIKIENRRDKDLDSYICYYLNPYLRHSLSEGGEDKWFRKSELIKNNFIFTTNEDINRFLSISNYGFVGSSIEEKQHITNEFLTTSRMEFLSEAKSIINSKSLKLGSFQRSITKTGFKDIGICSKITHIKIPANTNINKSICFSFNKEKEVSVPPILPIKDVDKLLGIFREKEMTINKTLDFKCETKDKSLLPFSSFFEHLKKQVEFCSTITGYVQLSELSLIGIRDIFQALEAYLYWNPRFVKNKILEALDYTFTNGRCPRQYSIPNREGENPTLDIRLFIDQGVWVISTIVSYLKVTGDYSILEDIAGYYSLNGETWEKSDIRDSVLEHIFKILDFLLSNICNETNCIYALYGDWNDALDGLGVSSNPNEEYGSGVSVMTTLQLYQNISEVIELLEAIYPGKYSSKISQLKVFKTKIERGLITNAIVKKNGLKKILHGWGDNRSYNIGGFSDPDNVSRDGLTSNAFWILSGLINKTPGLKTHILKSLNRLDSKYGYRTFWPGFKDDCPGVGRIKKLPVGTAENGAVYVHASTFAVMALFKMGEAKKAWEQLMKLLPFTHENVSCSPFVIPNSYGENAILNIDGESMLDWQTGSSNVVFKTIIRYALGVEPGYNGIWIQPAKWQPFNSFKLTLNIRDFKINLHYLNNQNTKRTFVLNDKKCMANKIWLDYSKIENNKINIEIYD